MATPIALSALAQKINGVCCSEPALLITGAKPLTSAKKTDISFVLDDKQKKQLDKTDAGAIIAKPGFTHLAIPIIEVADPFKAFMTMYQYFHPLLSEHPAHIDPKAQIAESVSIGADCYIGPHVVMEDGVTIGKNCRIHPGVVIGRGSSLGDDVTLYPNTVIYHGCVVGNRVIIHANAIIGADGFGYKFEQGRHVKVPQLAGVIIEDDVEIGAGTAIDRGTFEPTIIGAGTKIDNMVQIGHNCKIGKHNMIVSQVGIGGSSCTGEYVVIAGQVGIADHVHIGSQAVIGAKSGVHTDIEPGTKVLGAPARPERDAKLILLSMDRLPEMRQDMRQIKKQLGLAG